MLEEDLYCPNCGNEDQHGFSFDDNYGGWLHYKCNECEEEIVIEEIE